MRVVEAFSGIGSQSKALKLLEKEINLQYEIVNTIEWDINSIFAYDIIHNGKQDLSKLSNISREELIKKLNSLNLSYDGRSVVNENHFNRYNTKALKSIYYAIKRTNNLISIKDVGHHNFPDDIDVLTYSFPCQDLSLSGFFHGDSGGINKGANNSSSLLWEVERILYELRDNNKELPRVLLMENVASIRNSKHIDNFNKWRKSLEDLGYISAVEDLNALDFGIPQSRNRSFMISVRHNNCEKTKSFLNGILKDDKMFPKDQLTNIKKIKLNNILKLDYTNEKYRLEALEHIPNKTKSRDKILKENLKILDDNFNIDKDHVRTITTKQDRHPNSGVIKIDRDQFGLDETKSEFRFITPREAFLLMGFSEKDYEALLDNNFKMTKKFMFLTKFKLTKMAGNSIVVNVIKEVFKKIKYILDEIDNLKLSNMKIDKYNEKRISK